MMPDIQTSCPTFSPQLCEALFSECFGNGCIRRLLLILVIPEQGPSLPFEESRNPRVLVGESPGLQQLARWLLHAESRDVAVHLCLRAQRGRAGIVETNVEFCDVQFESELCEPVQILCE